MENRLVKDSELVPRLILSITNTRYREHAPNKILAWGRNSSKA